MRALVAALLLTLSAAGGYWAGIGDVTSPHHGKNAPIAGQGRLSQPQPLRPSADANTSSNRRSSSSATPDDLFSAQRIFIAKLQQTPSEKLAELFEEVQKTQDQYLRRATRELLFHQWALTDPDGAVETVRQRDSGQLPNFFTAWLRAAPDAALAWAQAPANRSQLPMVLNQLVSVDPERFLATAAKMEAKDVPPTFWPAALSRMAKKDLDRVEEMFETSTQKDFRREAASVIASRRADNDPSAALEWARALGDAGERKAAVSSALAKLAMRNPEAAIKHVTEGEELDSRTATSIKQQIARGLAKKDPYGALDWALDNLDARNSASVIQSAIADEMKTASPAEAVQLQERIVASWREKFGIEEGTPMASMLRLNPARLTKPEEGGSDTPPMAKIEQVLAMPAGESRDSMLANLSSEAARRDPHGMLEKLATLPDSARTQAARQLSEQFIRKGDTAAFLQVLPSIAEKERVYVVGRMAEASSHSPQHGTAFVDALPPAERKAAAGGITRAWANYDPDAAMAWASSRPEAEMTAAYQSIATVRSWSDAYGTSEWVGSLPAGAPRDAAAAGLATQIAGVEPDSAWQWALSINDPTRRRETLSQVFSRWKGRDAVAAQAALDAAPLPASDRQSVENQKLPTGMQGIGPAHPDYYYYEGR